MINKELFDRTISILVNAYFKGTLRHGTTCGCAVGNLIFEPKSLAEIKELESKMVGAHSEWFKVSFFRWSSEVGLEEIKKTGYSINEIGKIESAFECVNKHEDNNGYLGLMSVVDTLMQIHSATPQEAQSAKELFVLADVG